MDFFTSWTFIGIMAVILVALISACGVVFVVLLIRRYGPALHQPEPRKEGDDPPER
jgi:hypothetical protein